MCPDEGYTLRNIQPLFTHNYFILKTFEELGVSEEIRRAIEELGFEQPMPVQEEVIPYLLGSVTGTT